MTDNLNLELSKAGVKALRIAEEYKDNNGAFSFHIEHLASETSNGMSGVFAGVLELALNLAKKVSKDNDTDLEEVLAACDKAAVDKWS